MTVRGYDLFADWSRNGVYSSGDEALATPGVPVIDGGQDIVVEVGRSEARSTDDAQAGKLSFRLLNSSRKFSPENTASPIAGKVLPGTTVKFQVTLNGTITKLHEGPIDSLTADTTAKTMSFDVLDGWGIPGQESLSTPVYSGQRTGFLIGVILDAIGWTGPRDLDPGATVVPWWWAENVDAVTAVNDLVHSEGPPAIAYVQGGVFTFRDRHHRLTRTASTVSQGTYTHIIPAGSGPAGDFKMLKDSFSYDHGLSNIINSATLEVTPRIPTSQTVVWSSTTPLTLAANETQTLIVQTDDPFMFAVAPDNTTQYVMDDAPTTDYVLGAGSVAGVTLSRTSGQSLYLTITAGGSGAYLIDGLRMRAVPLVSGPTYKFSQEDASSVGTFRRNTWGGTAPWANIYDADALTQIIVATYALARPTVTFEVASSNGLPVGYLAGIVARKISDQITIRNDEMGLNAPYMVERLVHTVQKLGIKHTLQISAQVPAPTQPANALTFNVAGKGFNDGAFGVNGIPSAANMFTFDTAGRGFDQGVFAT